MPDTEMKRFGLWIKQARQLRGLTQDTLAERVGCATTTIRKIESGERHPSFQMAARLTQILEPPKEQLQSFLAAVNPALESPPATSSPGTSAEPPVPFRQLPIYLTPLIGRTQLSNTLSELLSTPECRLVTLVGPGGIGKTRLAVVLARQLHDFADGISFVQLMDTQNLQSVVSASATGLGVTEGQTWVMRALAVAPAHINLYRS